MLYYCLVIFCYLVASVHGKANTELEPEADSTNIRASRAINIESYAKNQIMPVNMAVRGMTNVYMCMPQLLT